MILKNSMDLLLFYLSNRMHTRVFIPPSLISSTFPCGKYFRRGRMLTADEYRKRHDEYEESNENVPIRFS